jgi:hypothetical protein
MQVRRLIFVLTERTGGSPGYLVRLSADSEETVDAPFECDPQAERKTSEALAAIEAGSCGSEDLYYVGSKLWGGLCSGKVRDLFRRIREAAGQERCLFHARIVIPPALEALPWETLYDSRLGFLATNQRFAIIRDMPEQLDRPEAWKGSGRPLRLLLVTPEGSGLDLGKERDFIMRRTAELGDAVEVGVLDGPVTVNRLRKTLSEKEWDVFHYAGHAQTTARGEVEIRLNSEDSHVGEFWMEAEQFSTLFNLSPVRLVVMNCCRGASVYRSRTLSGLGPFLLRKGVPAVVAMRYDIPDRDSLRFADEFYRVLFVGPEPGRVDLAVEAARVAVYQNQTESTVRSFITPAFYLVPGHEQLFTVPARPDVPVRRPEREPAPAPSGSLVIPDELLEVLRRGKCVPVIGPGLLRDGAVRSAEAPPGVPPGPLQLARHLARQCQYPRAGDFTLVEGAGEWMDFTLLQWVCQHFHSLRKIQHKLYDTIVDAYAQARPTPSLHAIVSWKVPGIICLHFDGMAHLAAKEAGKEVQPLNALDAKVAVKPGDTLLVHVRGTWTDTDTLILTEEEHDRLWDRLADLPSLVTDLVHATRGRSLLLLGVHPRDPLARRLCAKLLNPQVSGKVGPIFFACTEPTEVDEAYWGRIKAVEWIRAEPGALVAALDSALPHEGEGR